MAMSYQHTLKSNLAHQDSHETDLRCAASKIPDHADRAAHTHRDKGLFNGARAAHFDHVIHSSAASEFHGPLSPLGRADVVDGFVSAQPAGPLQLFVAARSDDDS